jgi:hypothetical protein
VVPTPLPFQLVLPFTRSGLFAPFHAVNYLLTRAWKSLFAYQFVITATPWGARVLPDSEPQSTPARELVNR